MRKDLTCTKCVVSDLAVTHVVVRGKTNGSSVCLERHHGIVFHETVEIRRVCGFDRIGNGVTRKTNAVHYDGEDRSGNTREVVQFVQLVAHLMIILQNTYFHKYYYNQNMKKCNRILKSFRKIFNFF